MWEKRALTLPVPTARCANKQARSILQREKKGYTYINICRYIIVKSNAGDAIANANVMPRSQRGAN